MHSEQLIRYIEGNATQAEKDAIARWLDQDETNWEEFLALRKTYDFTLGQLNRAMDRTLPAKKKDKKRVVLELLKIAAVFILSFSCFYLFNGREQTEEIVMHTIHVPAGQRAELTLADGTNVWLNANTTLKYPSRFSGSKREVELDGEAYFSVEHDPNHAFIAHTKQYAVKVLGTEFNVSAYSDNMLFETSLVKGEVEVFSLKTNEFVKLSAGNRVFLENGKLIIAPIRHFSHFLWKNGLISFENERMETILEKLRLYYDVNIEVKNKKILDLRYTGKFWTKDGVEHVIKVIKIHANFEYMKDSEQNMIMIY